MDVMAQAAPAPTAPPAVPTATLKLPPAADEACPVEISIAPDAAVVALPVEMLSAPLAPPGFPAFMVNKLTPPLAASAE